MGIVSLFLMILFFLASLIGLFCGAVSAGPIIGVILMPIGIFLWIADWNDWKLFKKKKKKKKIKKDREAPVELIGEYDRERYSVVEVLPPTNKMTLNINEQMTFEEWKELLPPSTLKSHSTKELLRKFNKEFR